MANLYAPRTAFNWTDEWCDGNDGVQDAGKYPGEVGGDVANFDADSGNCTVDVTPANALTGLNMAFGASAFDGTMIDDGIARTIDVDGDATLAGTINYSAGVLFEVTGNLTTSTGATIDARNQITWNGTAGKQLTINGVTLPNITLNGTGTLTTQDAVTAKSWNSSVGTHTYVDGTDLDHTINGTLDFGAAGCTLTSDSDWEQTATGDLRNQVNANAFKRLVISGGTITRKDVVYCKSVSVAAGVTLTADAADDILYVYQSTAADSLEILGAIDTGDVAISLNASRANSKTVKMADRKLIIYSEGGDYVWTQSGPLTQTASNVYISGVGGRFAKLFLSGRGHSIYQYIIGSAIPLASSGQLDFGSSSSKIGAGGLAVGDDANTQNAVDFGSAYIVNAGAIDLNQGGTNPPTLTNTDAKVIGGDIDNTDLTGQTALLHFWPNSAGANNTNVTELSPQIGVQVLQLAPTLTM